MSGSLASPASMRAEDVVRLYVDMEARGVHLWIMGGWGVDALLGRQTREHDDLDVLVDVRRLERLRERLCALGFAFRYVWDDETWWVHNTSWSQAEALPTAFVYGSRDGREVDIHVVRHQGKGRVTTLWNSPYQLTAAGLRGRGSIAGHPVRCLTAAMQRVAHTGYDLPPHHAADLTQLVEAAALD